MSHTYTNLKQRLTASKASKEFAEVIPLVHCIRNHVDLSHILNFLKTGDFSMTDSRRSTQIANNTLGIPEGVMFFYAGRAFPEKGIRMALLYGGAFDTNQSESIENHILTNNPEAMACGVRPFDSGGLVVSDPTKRLRFDVTQQNARSYFNSHNLMNVSQWREYFALILTGYFTSPDAYWDGFPSKQIDGIAFEPKDDWRNWTFELHSKWKVSPNLAGEIIVNSEIERHLQNLAGFGGAPSIAASIDKIVRFHHSPRAESEREARKARKVG